MRGLVPGGDPVGWAATALGHAPPPLQTAHHMRTALAQRLKGYKEHPGGALQSRGARHPSSGGRAVANTAVRWLCRPARSGAPGTQARSTHLILFPRTRVAVAYKFGSIGGPYAAVTTTWCRPKSPAAMVVWAVGRTARQAQRPPS